MGCGNDSAISQCIPDRQDAGDLLASSLLLCLLYAGCAFHQLLESAINRIRESPDIVIGQSAICFAIDVATAKLFELVDGQLTSPDDDDVCIPCDITTVPQFASLTVL